MHIGQPWLLKFTFMYNQTKTIVTRLYFVTINGKYVHTKYINKITPDPGGVTVPSIIWPPHKNIIMIYPDVMLETTSLKQKNRKCASFLSSLLFAIK